VIGKTLGHYQITSQLGKGGMGEVYQAKDQKLGRDVAIKMLPEEFAKDADRVARFQREAKLLASLNHPNIAAIHGLEESGGTNFLVLELVEGGTLADRIKAGPIPVEESLKLALQIAEALEAAHEKSVIHRDLKPANIKVTPDGKVKILDFGLAKAFAGEQAELNLSNSPTLSNAATQQGVILGTAAYMSPEQAKGKAVDKRTDIWAFGCVLYEMLAGEAAFQGEDVTEILASVVKGGVNLDLLPSNLHPRVREVITRCLQKDLKKRYPDITDVRYEIEKALADPGGVFAQPVMAVEGRISLRTMLPWIAGAVALAAIVVGVAVWYLKPTPLPEPRPVVRFDYELPEGHQFSQLLYPVFAVSPDGRRFVYSAPEGLYLRNLDELDARLIPKTEGSPSNPFFSADGKWIGYWSSADSKLKKIALTGGPPVPLCNVQRILGAGWGKDDSIVYADLGRGIMRISANGGNPEAIVKPEKNEVIIAPQILPDGESVLFSRVIPQPSKVFVQSLKSGERKELISSDTARYIPTGHIVYAGENNISAGSFDPKKLKMTGEPITLIEGIWRAGGTTPQYAFSDSGTLVYMAGTTNSAASQRILVWVNRDGKEETLGAAPNNYRGLKISPEGTKVAVHLNTSGRQDIWIWDLIRKNLKQLTSDAAVDNQPLWTSNGKWIVFASNREGDYQIYRRAADGAGKDELIGSVPRTQVAPAAWSSDEKTLVLIEMKNISKGLNTDIGALSLEGDRRHGLLLKEEFTESQPQISPNGRWMAYTSDKSGLAQINVCPFPEIDGGRWQVSENGGNSPLWSRDGRELFYRNGDAVMVVPVNTEPTFSFETPKILFQKRYVTASAMAIVGGWTGRDSYPWDIGRDGRFLMIKEVEPATATGESPRKINIVLNWFEELKQRVPDK
jgi:Tol biopolymer transport system component